MSIIQFGDLQYGERFRAVDTFRGSDDIWIRLFTFEARQYLPVPENNDNSLVYNAIVWDIQGGVHRRKCGLFSPSAPAISLDRATPKLESEDSWSFLDAEN
jgi:hypothetical protein